MRPITTTACRPFLKWAGGKYRLLPHIIQRLPNAGCLIEPFTGAGSVFLNTNYPSYRLNDINGDLINLYRQLQQHGATFIARAKAYFTPQYNCAARYYALRDYFNAELGYKKSKAMERAALFLYFNRHGFNGLCRYNHRGYFNVPFGSYLKPYFPEQEMLFFHQKAQQAEFICADFVEIFATSPQNSVIYCDPPYIPLSTSANFTQYSQCGFNLESQHVLAELAEVSAARGTPVIISNHDIPYTRTLYHTAQQIYFYAARNISCNGHKRQAVAELLAIYTSSR